jgi:hypothetical protein
MTDAPKDARDAARKRIEDRRNFVPHLIVYLVINAGLILLWAASDGVGFFWPGIVLIGWGVGLLMHAWNAFFSKPISEADVDRELQRMR